jgi:hypothetical protein
MRKLLALFFMSLLGVSCGAESHRMKRIVLSGWDLLHVTTADVWRNRAKFAATGADGALLPIDGVRRDGSSICGYWIMNGKGWKDEYFAETRRQLAEITAQPGLCESFGLMLWTPRKRLAWTDDAAWNEFIENIGIYARTARLGGLKGVVIDEEDYSKSKQFSWIPGDPAQKELLEIVRRRGREVFGRLYKEFPNAVVMTYRLFSRSHIALKTVHPEAVNLAKGDLWMTFINGLLDVAPQDAYIVEGNEDRGYAMETNRDDSFKSVAEWTRQTCSRYVEPENRAKYAETLSVSFGQYIDEYANHADSDDSCFSPLDGSSVKRFRRHLSAALKAADEYVWVYGERCTWIDWDDKKNDKVLMSSTWEAKFPGLSDMFRSVKTERVTVRPSDKDLVNLFGNSNCDLKPGQVLPFPKWTDNPKAPSPFAYEPNIGASKPGCLKLTGDGLYAVDVGGLKEGEQIVVKVKAMGQSAFLHLIWTHKGERQWHGGYVDICPLAEMKEGEWTELSAVVEVPVGASWGAKEINGVNIQLRGVYASPEHPLYYDDIQVLKRK